MQQAMISNKMKTIYDLTEKTSQTLNCFFFQNFSYAFPNDTSQAVIELSWNFKHTFEKTIIFGWPTDFIGNIFSLKNIM